MMKYIQQGMIKGTCTVNFVIKSISIFTTLMGLSVVLINTVFAPFLQEQNTNIIIQPFNPNKTFGVKHKPKYSICPQFSGRLGNKMFTFASSYGIALEKAMTVELDKTNELWRVFNLSVDVSRKGSNCKSGKIRVFRERKPASFDKQLLEFEPTSSVSLRTYLQSYLYFDKYKVDVKKQFTFRKEIQSKADAIMKNILYKHNILNRNHITLIGIHVRRGDLARLSVKDKAGGFIMASKEYLKKAVEWYKARYKNLLFIAASNGMDWTKENMPTNIRVEYLENNTAPVDLAVLASSDQFISTLGCFSWWAGWLTGGNVTYYKWPAAEGGRYRKSFSKDFMDHYYKHWIGF